MLNNLSTSVTRAASCLRRGGNIAIPTETVYGLAANALDASAVLKIFEIKGRPLSHPLIVHIAEKSMAEELSKSFPEKASQLASAFWPGPLTLVLPNRGIVSDTVTAGLDTVALRIPSHPLTLRLISACGFPLAAPSANVFGKLSPTNALQVSRDLGSQVELILDGGPCGIGVESTIIGFNGQNPILLRLGGVPIENIEKIIGPVERPTFNAKPIAPGMLARHYSPNTPLFLLEKLDELPQKGLWGLLCFEVPHSTIKFKAVEVLSPSGDLKEAASRLYGALRRLDEAGLNGIISHRFPNFGLGKTINDRLERAQHGSPFRKRDRLIFDHLLA